MCESNNVSDESQFSGFFLEDSCLISGHRGKTCIVPFFMSVGLYRSLICTLSPLFSTATESLQQQQPLFEEWHLSS